METGNSSRQSFIHGNRTSVKLRTIVYTRVIMEIETLFWHDNVHIINIPQREPLYLCGFEYSPKLIRFSLFFFVCSTHDRYAQSIGILNIKLKIINSKKSFFVSPNKRHEKLLYNRYTLSSQSNKKMFNTITNLLVHIS